MYTRAPLLAILLMLGAEAHAQATLKGRVLRDADREPITGAEVWLPASDARITTDSTGAFLFEDLTEGAHIIQVRRVGFAVRRDTAMLAPGRVTSREYLLTSQSATLDTVKTVAGQVKYVSPALRGFEERRLSGGSGHFIPEEELRKHDNKSMASVVLSRTSGIHIVPDRYNSGFLASTRKTCSGRVFSGQQACTPCYVTIYMDGQLVFSAREGEKPPVAFDMNRMPVNQFAGVEFYPGSGTGPPQYNVTGGGCGTLLLWTRER